MIGVYFFLLFPGCTILLFSFEAVEAGLDRFWRAMAFSAIPKTKIQSQKIWLVCSATTSIWALG